MGSYDLPEITEGITPDEAQEVLNKINADSMADREHPWVYGNHPQHENFVSRVNELNKVLYQDEDESPRETEMQEGLDSLVNQQSERVEQAEEVMEGLVELGFEEAPIPENISDYEAGLLLTQLLAARNQWDNVTLALDEALKGSELFRIEPPAYIRSLFQSYKECDDDEIKENMVNDILVWLCGENRRKREILGLDKKIEVEQDEDKDFEIET